MSRNFKTEDIGKLTIPEFTFDEMVDHPSIVMVAKRGSGKSWVARSILDHFSDIPVGLIIAPTDRMNCFYGHYFPPVFIHYEYKTKKIEDLLMRQKAIIKKKKDKALSGKYIDDRAFIIMDDCLGQKDSWVRDQPIQELLFNGRHYRVMYILTMQTPLGITPDLRNNFDYIILLADDVISNLKKIHQHYAGIFPDFNIFRQVFNELTADYGAMVLLNRGARSNFVDKLRWYKAPNLTDKHVKYGCNQFRKYNERNFDTEWEDKHMPFDIAEYCDKTKKDRCKVSLKKVGPLKS